MILHRSVRFFYASKCHKYLANPRVLIACMTKLTRLYLLLPCHQHSGSEAQASKYMMVDLDGRATALFPYRMDQDDNDEGWVMTLDWTPGTFRYQVDRKIKGGPQLLCLRTLELSEVMNENADLYRPRDGGADMLQ
jgi:hypothetical protein